MKIVKERRDKLPRNRPFFSSGEVAAFLGVSKNTIYFWEKMGWFEPKHRTKGGHRMYSRADIMFAKGFINGREKHKGYLLKKMRKNK
jgi:DNA-binding transcriptional MerR regulator